MKKLNLKMTQVQKIISVSLLSVSLFQFTYSSTHTTDSPVKASSRFSIKEKKDSKNKQPQVVQKCEKTALKKIENSAFKILNRAKTYIDAFNAIFILGTNYPSIVKNVVQFSLWIASGNWW